MKKRFIKLLLKAYDMSAEEQKNILWSTLKDWQGSNEQVDDISLIGFKIK